VHTSTDAIHAPEVILAHLAHMMVSHGCYAVVL